MLNEDYRDILQILLRNKVGFLVVGAYAMGIHGYPRATGDFDIWVEASARNSSRTYKALAEFGAPLARLEPGTFARKGIIFQIGVAPRRIDIITEISGVSFPEAYRRRVEVALENIRIPFLSKKDLIASKEATNRERDKLDAEYLRKSRRSKSGSDLYL